MAGTRSQWRGEGECGSHPPWVSLCTAAHMLWSWPILAASQPAGKPHPWMCQQPSRLNCNVRAQTAHTRGTPGTPSSGDPETVPLSPTGHLLRKATLTRLGDSRSTYKTQKQTERGSLKGETKKHAPTERTGKISRKRAL